MNHENSVYTKLLTRSAQMALLAVHAAAWPATLYPGFREVPVASGFSRPTAMAFAPDGRLFVIQQDGDCRVIKNGQLLPQPFVHINTDNRGERGLLGIAFDPNFASNRWVYLYHTLTTTPIRNRITRWTANGDVHVPGSDVVIKEFEPLTASIHNGGAIHFGPDGKMYVGVGENSRGYLAQSLDTTLGKILRLNSDGSIPADNPFCGTQELKCAVWALGLRNPFTFAIQPGSGKMFINDVGGDTFEEINEALAGDVNPGTPRNYGWPFTEGTFNTLQFPGFRNPFHAYAHGNTAGECAITGGTFYNPSTMNFPSLYSGRYFFADVCAGWIKTIDLLSKSVEEFASGIGNAIDLKVGPDGALYYLGRNFGVDEAGTVSKITAIGNEPQITQMPVGLTVKAGTPATFSVAASGAGILVYQWQRNSIPIPGATLKTYTVSSPQAADNGATFRVVVTNSFGSTASGAAILTVTTSQPPVATILQPAAGTLYSGAEKIAHAGSAIDAEDGPLPASAYSWQVLLHHDAHTHPFIPPTPGVTGGSFTIPTTGHLEHSVWYRIYLTVTDSSGAKQTVTRDLLPRQSQINIVTNPPGLTVAIDGIPQSTPLSAISIVGMQRRVSAPVTQIVDGITYRFRSWSDAQPIEHDISTPVNPATYTAEFTLAGSCENVAISGGAINVPTLGQAASLLVTAANSCSWVASSDASWLQVYPLSSAGGGTLNYTVYPNFSTRSRTAMITVGNKTVSVVQAGSTDSYNERFVQRLYFNSLGRLASAAEIAFQVAALNQSSRSALFMNFFNTLEFNLGGRYAAALYVGLLDRDAEYSGWLFQRNALTMGLTDQLSMVDAFLDSQEFFLKFGAPTDDAFVRQLYRFVLLREPAPEEVVFQVAALRSGLPRAQLASAFLNSPEFRIGTGPRLTAFLLYAVILQRAPTALELYQTGGQIGAGVRLDSLAGELLNSVEFENQ